MFMFITLLSSGIALSYILRLRDEIDYLKTTIQIQNELIEELSTKMESR